MDARRRTPRTAVVTGGAGGIGTAICRQLAADNYRVVIADLDEAAAKRLAEELPEAVAVHVDLDDDASTAAFISTVGDADVVVNNAGATLVERFTDSDPGTWDRLWRVNLRAPMRLAHGFLPGMVERGWGRLVFVSSDSARAGSGGEAVYAACKAGLFGLAKTLAREAAAHGVTSNVVCPGPTDTPMLRSVAGGNPGLVAKLTRAIPVGRLGAPEDIAAAIAFLCAERAGYITGQTLSVSGGITMT